MPELPDITVCLNALAERIDGRRIDRLSILRPFLLRTVEPSPAAVAGRCVIALKRIGKCVAIGAEDELWIVIHLMIAGRLHWQAKPPKRWSAARKAKRGTPEHGLSSRYFRRHGRHPVADTMD